MIPPSWTLLIDRSVRRREQGRLVIGGAPLGVLRLTPAGARVVDRLATGEPVGDRVADQKLVKRLLDRGMAHPRPVSDPNGEPPSAGSLAVIIPVKDDPEGLRSTLNGLDVTDSSAEADAVVVVDDGSRPPLGPCPSVTMLRNERPLGPGGARNRGIDITTEPFLAFVDAGVNIDRDRLRALCAHFADPAVVAVAPRVRSRSPFGDSTGPDPGRAARWLERYEHDHSPLDLGPHPARVGPGTPVGYVPSACLIVRRSALRSVGPFDPALRFGEDVDLVWRLGSVGSIRYDPSVVATHPHRRSLASFVRQRFSYGSSAGALASRHGDAVAPMRASAWTYGVIAALLLGRPLVALGLHAYSTMALARKLGDLPDAGIEALRFTALGNGWALRTASQNTLRVWWPLTVVAVLCRPTRRIGIRTLAASIVGRVLTRSWSVLGLVDDVAYGSGVLVGTVIVRSPAALLPAAVGQSGSGNATMRSSRATTSRAWMPR